MLLHLLLSWSLLCRPDIDVDVIGPVFRVVAQDMPARLASHKPGLIPAGILIAEVSHLGIAALASRIVADLPFIGPVLSRSAYLGPERDPLAAVDASYSICNPLAGEDVVLIAPALRRFWEYGFAALGRISMGGRMSLWEFATLTGAALIDIGAVGIDPISDQSGCSEGGLGHGGRGLSLRSHRIALDGICGEGDRRVASLS